MDLHTAHSGVPITQANLDFRHFKSAGICEVRQHAIQVEIYEAVAEALGLKDAGDPDNVWAWPNRHPT